MGCCASVQGAQAVPTTWAPQQCVDTEVFCCAPKQRNTPSCCFFRASSVERFISNLSSNFLLVFRKIRKADLKACMIHVWFGGLYKYRSARPSYRTDLKIVEGAGAWPNHTSEPRQAHSSVRWQRVGSLGMATERERESTQLGIQAGI